MTSPDLPTSTPESSPASTPRRRTRDRRTPRGRDRSIAMLVWYRIIQFVAIVLFSIGGVRATGRANIPRQGGVLLVSNHLSFWDVFVLGLLLPRPLNYVARSTLFKPVLSFLIRSVGGFPIQREGMGSQGFKETLRRLNAGGIVTLFPEGTRSPNGELGPLKPGIATLATRARVPIVPAGVAGTFEAWSRARKFPRPHPIRVHYGPPISPEQLDGLRPDDSTALIRDRLLEAQHVARTGLASDLGHSSRRSREIGVGHNGKIG